MKTFFPVKRNMIRKAGNSATLVTILLLLLSNAIGQTYSGLVPATSAEKVNFKNELVMRRTLYSDSLYQKEKRSIVEFWGETLAEIYSKGYDKSEEEKMLRQTKQSQQDILRQFSSDLQQIQKKGFSHKGKSYAYFMKVKTGRTYRIVYFGQQVTSDSMMIREIEKLPYVKAVHPDRKIKMHLDESVHQIGADSVWYRLNCTGDSIRVGILDTGIDYMHPDLGGGFGPGFKVIGGYDFVNQDEDPRDDNEHGTHVAGIVAANGTIKGVAPGALLFALKVLDNSGSGWEEDIIAAIEYSVDPDGDEDPSDHLDVANMSLGGEPIEDDPMIDAVEAAISLGVTYCISAGNNGMDGYMTIGSPGDSPSAITVGAVDKENAMPYYSSMGPTDFTFQLKPDVVAPGVDINSTVPNGMYEHFGGTSMAAPHVAGACALLKKLHPDWTPAMIKASLVSTCIDLGVEPVAQGSGLINVYQAAGVQSLFNKAMVYFGLDSLPTESHWLVNDSVRLTNISDDTVDYRLSERSPVTGITLSYPDSITLAPGESIRLELTIDVDNSLLTGENIGFSGYLSLSNSLDTIQLGWSFVRSFSLRFQSDLRVVDLYIFNENSILMPYIVPWEPLPEFIMQPGSYYIFAELYDTLESYNPLPRWLIIKEVDLEENCLITMNREDANHTLIFDTEDLQGMNYSDYLAKSRGTIFYLPDNYILEAIRYTENSDGRAGWFTGSFGYPENMHMIRSESTADLRTPETFSLMDTLYYSDLPEGTQIFVSEARRKKEDGYQFCFNEEGPLAIQDTIMLKTKASDYATIHIENNYPGLPSMWYPKLFWKTERPDDIGYFLEGGADPVGANYSLSLVPKSDMERELFHYFTIMRNFDYITVPIQFIEDQIILGNGPTAGAFYFDPGDTIPSTAAPWSGGILNSEYKSMLRYYPHLQGAMGEASIQINSAAKIYNESGTVLDSGFVAQVEKQPGKYRIEYEIKNGRRIYDKGIINYIQSFIDTEQDDYKPPYLRYLSFRNKEGIPVSFVPKGDSVSLYLTLTSEEHFEGYEGSGLPVPYDSVEVHYKHSDSTSWQTLPVDSLGYDWRDGLTCGGIFRETDMDSAYFDLLISAADSSGNKTLTQISPAIFVKNVQQPQAGDDSYDVTPGRLYRSDHSVLDNDSDPFDQASRLKIILSGLPEHGELTMASGGHFKYDPEDDFEGIDQFYYRVENELYISEPATVTLDVTPENIENLSESRNEAWIYPNPARDQVNIGLNLIEPTDLMIEAYSITGLKLATLYSGRMASGAYHIPLNPEINFDAGIYLIKIDFGTGFETLPLIIE